MQDIYIEKIRLKNVRCHHEMCGMHQFAAETGQYENQHYAFYYTVSNPVLQLFLYRAQIFGTATLCLGARH